MHLFVNQWWRAWTFFLLILKQRQVPFDQLVASSLQALSTHMGLIKWCRWQLLSEIEKLRLPLTNSRKYRPMADGSALGNYWVTGAVRLLLTSVWVIAVLAKNRNMEVWMKNIFDMANCLVLVWSKFRFRLILKMQNRQEKNSKD